MVIASFHRRLPQHRTARSADCIFGRCPPAQEL